MTGEFRARFPNTRRAAAFARRSLIAPLLSPFGAVGFSMAANSARRADRSARAPHGHRTDTGFEVCVYVERERIVIEVQDEGGGFPSSVPTPKPGHDAPRGFGIYLMRHLMDEVDFNERGTRVRLTKRLPIARQHGVSC